MDTNSPYLYREVQEILDQEVADRRAVNFLLKENDALASEAVCALDPATLKKKIASLVDRWNQDLLNEVYIPLMKKGIQDYKDYLAAQRKTLPAMPDIPAGYKDYAEAERALTQYAKEKSDLERDLVSEAAVIRSLHKDLLNLYGKNPTEIYLNAGRSAKDAFQCFDVTIFFTHSSLPENLHGLIGMGIHVKGVPKAIYVYTDGSLPFTPDFTYARDPRYDGYIMDFFLVSGEATTLTEKVMGKAKKAAQWVQQQQKECQMLEILRRLVNTLRIKEAGELRLGQVKRKMADLKEKLPAYKDYRARTDTYCEKEREFYGLKGNVTIGTFVAQKGKMQRAGQAVLDPIRKKYAAELHPYGLHESELDDIRWPEYVTTPEKAREAKEKLVNRLFNESSERIAHAVTRRKQMAEQMAVVNGHENYLLRLKTVQELDPVLGQVLQIDPEQLQTLKKCAAGRESVALIPTGQHCSTYKGLEIYYPQMVPWHQNGKASNICLELPKGSGKNAEDRLYHVMNNLLFNMLMAFSPGQVRLHFIDFNLSGRGGFFLQNFDGAVTGSKAVTDESALRELLARLQDKLGSARPSPKPYDVVVLLDAPKQLTTQHARTLQPLYENGYKGGISFVAVDTGSRSQGDGSALLSHPSFVHVPLSEEPMQLDTLFDGVLSRDDCIEQFRQGLEDARQVPVIHLDYEALGRQAFQDTGKGLRIPVGSTGGQRFDFRLDQVSHPHAFVLGQSGSGKSVLLHNVIMGAVLQYAPEDLQLYLMDLKIGGVEFKAYKSLPHTKAVLLDDSDRQIIREILRDIIREMKSRGERMRNASSGIVKIEEYNQAFPQDRLAQIMIIVDECQRLFSDRPDSIQREISEMMDMIASQGRNFGIHLVLATQTLHGSVISAVVRKNISDFYLLKGGMADGLERQMEEAAALTTGQVIYTNRSDKTLFQAFFPDRRSRETALGTAVRKASGHPTNNPFVFEGRTSFHLLPENAAGLRTAARRGPAGMAGREITIDLKPLVIPLQKDMGENLLILGAKASQAVSLAQQVYLGMMLSDKGSARPHAFYAIDCQDDPEMDYYPLYEALEARGSHLVTGHERGELISSLAAQVREGTAKPSVILLLSQERFRPLMMDAELPARQETDTYRPAQPAVPSFLQAGARGGSASRKTTYRSELAYLLEHGSEQGVHFIWEVDRLPNLLADATLSRQSLMRMFRHILMLRSVPDSVLRLGLPTEVDPGKLNDEDGRVRAWWIDLLDNRFRLFTPFETTRPDQLDELFNA